MNSAAFDRTYEGLKLPPLTIEATPRVTFDRTYEGLKLSKGLRRPAHLPERF